MSSNDSMRTLFRRARLLAVMVAMPVLVTLPETLAEPTTAEQAELLVSAWLQVDGAPLGTLLGNRVATVETFTDDQGLPAYYVVYLDPSGFVIVPADDWVEPVIAFASQGEYVPGLDNPLGAMIASDLPSRLVEVHGMQPGGRLGPAIASDSHVRVARQKWHYLLGAPTRRTTERGLTSVSDPRVDPLVQSRWNQTTVNGLACYNYYTPPDTAGDPTNYPCGCVATAMAQLMRFHVYPTAGVGTASFTIYVCSWSQSRDLRGGDGNGGPYDWSNMVLVAGASATTAERQAVGALCHDAGVAVSMNYCFDGSAADTLTAADALTTTFGYSNARAAWNAGGELPSGARNRMVNTNLDAGFPVLLGITGNSGGHAVVADGYGYNVGTLYHHLNMGWSGSSDAWYNLPNIDSSPSFTTLYKCIYNVYVAGSGEIISGRVLDPNGTPLSGAMVTSESGSDITDSRGIYALAKVPSGTQFTITVQKAAYVFQPQTVSTGTSIDDSTSCGNLWNVDFVATTTNYTLTTSVSGQGSVLLDPEGGSYAPGTVVTVTAIPAPSSCFRHWEGSLTGSQNPETLVMDGDKVVAAVFDSAYAWVDFDWAGPEYGTEACPFNTLAEGVANVCVGGVITIKAGSSPETMTISKPLTLEAPAGTVAIGQ